MTFVYAPYADLNYIIPIISIVMASLGLKIEFLTDDEIFRKIRCSTTKKATEFSRQPYLSSYMYARFTWNNFSLF